MKQNGTRFYRGRSRYSDTVFRRWRIGGSATAHHRQCADGRDDRVIIGEITIAHLCVLRYRFDELNAGRRRTG